MLRLLAAILAVFVVSGNCDVQFELRGHFVPITARLARNFDETEFSQKHDQAVQTFSQLFGSDFRSFVITNLTVHAAESDVPTSVFSGLLTTSSSISRNHVIEILEQNPQLSIYFAKQNENVLNAARYSPVLAYDGCQNGGFLLPNGTCFCRDYTSGASCENVLCRNYGIADSMRCACPPGAYSLHCENRGCSPAVQSSVDFSQQSLLLVINTKNSMALDLNFLIGNLPILLNDYTQLKAGILQNYIVTIYRYTKTAYFLETNIFYSSDDVINYLQSVVVGPSSEDQPHLDAVYAAQSYTFRMKPQSVVLLFADSEVVNAPTASTRITTNNETNVVQQILAWKNKIVFVISQADGSPLVPFSDEFDVLRRVAAATHGDVIVVNKSELEEVTSHLLSYFYEMQNTYVRYYTNTKSLVIPLLSDAITQISYVLLTVENGATVPSLADKNSNQLKPTSSGTNFALYRIQKSVSDAVTASATGTYSVRIFINSLDDVLIGYGGDDDDQGHAYQFSGFAQRASLYSTFSSVTSIHVAKESTSDGSTIVRSAEAVARNGSTECTFGYQLPSALNCTAGPYTHFIQISVEGATYTRVVPGYCVTPETQSAPGWTCLNNGTRAGTSTCNCVGNFNGQHCEVPICQNGGTVDKFPNGNSHGYCVCPYGFSGNFCELMTCEVPSYNSFESYNRTFALVVQNSLSMATGMTNLYDAFSIMLNKGASDDFADFILTSFKNRMINGTSTPQINVGKFSSAADFLNQTTALNIGYSYSPSGSQPGLLALESTLRSIDYDKSSIFVFTDSAATVAVDDSDYNNIVRTAIERQIEISIVLVPAYNLSSMCPNSRDLMTYQSLARHTGGNFINLCQTYTPRGDPILNFIASYGQSHHHTEVVNYRYVQDSSTTYSDVFYISDPSTSVYIVVNSPLIEQFSVSVINNDTGVQTALVADSHAVPFFASYPFKPTGTSNTAYTLSVVGVNASQGYPLWFRVIEKSQLSVYFGFAPDPSVDFYDHTILYGTTQMAVAHLSSALQLEPVLKVVEIDDAGYTVEKLGQKRYSTCRYEYVFTADFVCKDVYQSVTFQVDISNEVMHTQRTFRAYCDIDNNRCLNGGIYANGQCNCVFGFTGQYCQILPCQNGGTLSNFRCQCPLYYGGTLCQYQECYDWNYLETHDPRNLDFQQVVFAVESGSRNMVLATGYLQRMIPQFVNLTEDPVYPRQYSLVTFDTNGASVGVSSSHPDVFISSFGNYLKTGIDTNSTTRSIYGLLKSFEITIERPAIIYLFTATPPVSESTYDVIRQRFGVQVNTIFVNSTAIEGNIDYRVVASSRMSNGRILTVAPNLIGDMAPALSQMIRENALIYDYGAKDCSTAQTFTFFVESQALQLALTATGLGVTVTAANPLNQNVPISYSMRTLNGDNSQVITIDSKQQPAGQWTITLKTSSGSCFLQARTVSSDLHIVPGFTSDSHQDFVSPVPVVGSGSNMSSYITFRLVNYYGLVYGATVDRVEMYNTDPLSPWSSNDLKANVTVAARDPTACASQFVTPLVQWTSTYQKFIVYGIDGENSVFQRTFFFNKNNNPTMTDCKHGSIDTFGFCQCDANYQGYSCSVRKCQNGGTSAYGVCDCINGYYGDFCENYYSPN